MNNRDIYYCPRCGAFLKEQEGFKPSLDVWECTSCGEYLYGDELYDGERFPGVLWFCDSCGDLMNRQPGFRDTYDMWRCVACEFDNRIAPDAILDEEEPPALTELTASITEIPAASANNLPTKPERRTRMNNNKPFSPHEKLFAAFGKNPPIQAIGRLQSELSVMHRDFMSNIILLSSLREAAKEANADLVVTGLLSGTLIAWLYGCTDVNPLPPHYRCPVCKRAVFLSDGDGWDLPALACCGQPLYPDGHEIPLESALSVLEDKYQPLTVKTVSSFAERAEEIIRKYYRHDYNVIPFEDEYEADGDERLFALIPTEEALPELDEDGVWYTDRCGPQERGYRTIELHFSESMEKIRELREKTRQSPALPELLTKPVMAIVEAKIEELIRSEGATLLKSDEQNFSALLKLKGYLHSTHTDDNPVYQENGKLSNVFTSREDVWHLVKKGMEPEYEISDRFAEKIMNYTRRGKYTRNRMDPETELTLRNLGIEDRWIAQMKHTAYLPPRALLITSLLDELKLAWYEQKGAAE